MSGKFIANLPVNSVSFGQTSTLFLRTYLDNLEEFSKIKELNGIFPIGQEDLSSQSPDVAQKMHNFLEHYLIRGMNLHSRKDPSFKLWHLNGSIESYSDETLLLSFYELDNPTPVELNIAKNNKVAFTSKYTCDVFKNKGVDSVYIPLGFDDYNFKKTSRNYVDDGRIVFNVLGKFEKRKNHEKVIRAWFKRFAGNPKYFLQCAIYNPFFPNRDQQNQAIANSLQGGRRIFNSEFFGNMVQNSAYNDFLNSAHIVIGMSGGEGWGLPEFQSVALGKHAVIMDAHGYQNWANEKNSVLIKPSGKMSAVDNFFFHDGGPFNQGNIFDFNEDEFIHGCEEAIKRVESNPINTEGLKLQQDFSKEKFVKTVLNNL